MILKLQEKHHSFKRMFLYLWILFTTIFLVVALCYQWVYLHKKALQQFSQSAHTLTFKFDQMVEQALEAVTSSSIEVNENLNCKNLMPVMQDIVLNNFDIAGVVISDSHNRILCTTMPEHKVLPAAPKHSPVMFGPIKLRDNSKEFYLIEQQIGKNYIGVYLLSSLLDRMFQLNQNYFAAIGLYDNYKKSIIFNFGRVLDNPDFINKIPDSHSLISFDVNDKNDASVPIRTLDNIQLILSSESMNIHKYILFEAPLIIFAFIIISWIFYHYICKLINRRFSLEQAIKEALSNKEFYPEYQAVYDESLKAFTGAEVLIRWQTSNGEKVFPDYFIPEAEKTGLIVPMTVQLIEDTFTECKHLLHSRSEFHLAYNLSPGHFNDEKFFNQFYDLCKKYDIRPQQIILELTERELFDKSDKNIQNRMHELRKMGFSLALDDFGTGQANLNYLHCFPFNYIKIDKMFIHTIGTGAITETLTLNIIQMAHSMNLHIIAEGVETHEQLKYLQDNQVQFIQGWIYSRALPAQDFFNFLQSSGESL